MRDRKLFRRCCLYVDTSGQNCPDIPYMNELSAYLSDYYWKLSFVGYVQTKHLIDQQEKYKALKTFLFHLNHSISL